MTKLTSVIFICILAISLNACKGATVFSEEVTVVKTYETTGDALSRGRWTTVIELEDGQRKEIPGNMYKPGEKFTYTWTSYRR